jgi:hypothetical protein
VRTALVILVVIALVLVAIGAVNHAVTFDLDFLALSWTGISLFWLSVALAAVVLAGGVAAAWTARASAVAAQHKLEQELAGTYERLRTAQAAAERAAVAPAPAAPVLGQTAVAPVDAALEGETSLTEQAPAEVTAVTMIGAEAETAVAGAPGEPSDEPAQADASATVSPTGA